MRSTERPGFVLRDTADINRLRVHLLTHLPLPRAEFQMEALPALDSQRAQDRFVRLAGACNCTLGEVLGTTIVLGGCFIAWALSWGWRDVLSVAAVALCALLLGKGIELCWTRVRLLRVLRRLRRRLAGEEPDTAAQPAVPPAPRRHRHALNVAEGNVARPNRMQRPRLPDIPARPAVMLRDTAEINRLVLRLLTRWSLPRIEIQMNALPELVRQRAQHRCRILCDGYSFLLAAVLGTLTLLGGLFHVIWMSSLNQWTPGRGLRAAGLVAIIALLAGLLGVVLEVAWVRARLLLVLRGLRRQPR